MYKIVHKNQVARLPWLGGHRRMRTPGTTRRPADEGKDFGLLCSLRRHSAQDSVWHLEYIQGILNDKLMKGEGVPNSTYIS